MRSGLRVRPTRAETTAGSIAEPPPATRRTVEVKSSMEETRCLSRYPSPSAPLSIRSSAEAARMNCDRTTIATSGWRSRIASAACSPSSVCVGGMATSMRQTSGLWAPTLRSSSSPSPASPTTSKPCASSSDAIERRRR